MAAVSGLSMLFQSALEEYKKETGIDLERHPLVAQLERCDSVWSIIHLLYEQARNFHQFRGNDRKLLTVLSQTVEGLHMLSGIVTVGGAVGFRVSFVQMIYSSIGILLSVVQDINASYDALIDLFESICNFVERLKIYTEISPTPIMAEMIIKILVQLFSTLTVATNQVKQGRLKKFVKKLSGENDLEMALQRLDRLTAKESRAAAAQTLEVVHGLARNLSAVMSDRESSTYDIQKALVVMQQVVNNMNESKRGQLRRDVQRWLSPPDPWINYNIGCEAHHDGTARWFIQGDTFAAWKSSSDPLLWIHGMPGAGKSVLCSSIIKEINDMRESGLASLGFYYFDLRDDEKKHRRGLLSSLLFQLCDQSATYSDILFRLYSTHGDGSQSPSDSDLARCLEDMLRSQGQAPVYLVIDALDQCPNSSYISSPRGNVLKLVEYLANLRLRNLRICLTSRPEVDIKVVLDHLEFRSISLHDEEGQEQDILDYITSVVHSDPNMQMWRAECKKWVIDELSQKANGMFRWVFCQLHFLSRCLPVRVERALAELPTTLDDTYERMLLEISEANWEYAHRLLQCVAVACRPLHIKELAEFLAFDFDTGPIPEFYESFRLADPKHGVLSTCPSLLSVVNVDGSEVIQFSHFSVKQYLMSARLAEGSDIMSRRYHVSITGAHTIAAQACLGILLHLDENINRDNLETFPLAKYAAKHWIDHVQLEDVSQRVEAGLKQLFDPRKPHLAIWLWIHNPKHPSWIPRQQTERPPQPDGTCLHYAALYGLHRIIEFLVTEHRHEVNTLGFEDRSTPLHAAVQGLYSRASSVTTRVLLKFGADATAQDKNGRNPLHFASQRGNVKTTQILLARGADPTAQDKDGQTPLHCASQYGYLSIVSALIARGADADARDNDNCTPLHRASQHGHLEVVRVLLGHGIDVNARDHCKWTPLHEASYHHHVEVVQLLLEHGASANALDLGGWTPLQLPSHGGYLGVLRVLLEHGADVNTRDHSNWTPLHGASQQGHIEVVQVLLEHGADTNSQDDGNQTPLHLASRAGCLGIVQLLIEYNASVSTRNDRGRTPSQEASEKGHVNVVQLLLEHGSEQGILDAVRDTIPSKACTE